MEDEPAIKPILKILPATLEAEGGWDYWVDDRLELWVNDTGYPKAFDYNEERWLENEEISPRLEAYAEICTQE